MRLKKYLPVLLTCLLFTSGSIHLTCQQSLMPGGIEQMLKEGPPVFPLAGPDTLPAWADSAQVRLGWEFSDPKNPQDSEPLAGWDLTVGDTLPVWSYDSLLMAFGHPGQWYIRIPNLVNDNPVKHFWISWIYDFDTYLEGLRSSTNIEWQPDSGNANTNYKEEWFDSDGNVTTDYLTADYARVTYSIDLYPNPDYEDVWLGLFGDQASVLEVYLMTWCAVEKDSIPPDPPESGVIGPAQLPDWVDSAQVRLGWEFADPANPASSNPLTGWDIAVGDTIPFWSYDPLRTAYGHPAQWRIQIANLENNNPVKNFWISWVYEFDTYLEGLRSATNIEWQPDSGSANSNYVEEWFDADGNITTDYLAAAFARVTYSLDLYPNPPYEEIWLGLYGDNASAREVYIITRCVAGQDTLPPVEPPEYQPLGPSDLPDWSDSAQVQLGWVFTDPYNPQNENPLPGWDLDTGINMPLWSYDADRMAFGYPGQWYARIPNLINDNPVKNFWISWVYEFDPSITDIRTATNLDWPGTGSDNFINSEEWFDADGHPTTDHLQAVRARVTQSLDMFPNPPYEDVWLGVFGDTLKAREVYILTRCLAEGDTVPPVEPPEYNPFGPAALPEWSDSAQVKLGWIFDNPREPGASGSLSAWNLSVSGEVPQWSYDPLREAFGFPGQWYARIPNLVNDNPVKNFWISWVYEFDPMITDIRSATNLDWPGTGSDNFISSEEWFDADGNPTTNHLEAVWARITQSVDMFPNPPYEDVWLGVYGDTLNAREVYILTRCVAPDSIPPDTLTIRIDVKPGSDENPINPRSNGVIPVAIMTTEDFDAAEIDPSSLRFGPAQATPDKHSFEDTDEDGDQDMIVHFRTQLTGIACGDSIVVLQGQTIDGIMVKAQENIKTPGCR